MPSAAGLPLLVAVNKIDLPNHLSKGEVIRGRALSATFPQAIDLRAGLQVDRLINNSISIIEISALEEHHIDKVLEWVMEHSS